MRRRSAILGVGGLFVALAVAAAAHARAPAGAAEVQVELDRRSLTTDEQIEVTVTAEGEYDDLEPPSFKGFAVQGRRQSTQLQIINGAYSRQKVLSFTLQPRKAGPITIGPARALRRGKVVAQSMPLTVMVRKPSAPPPVTAERNRELRQRARKPYFLHAETARDAYYVGEPFVLEFKLYFRRTVSLSGVEITTKPALDGLLVEELIGPGERLQVRNAKLSGMRELTRSRLLATPLAPGVVTVDPMAVRLEVGDFFRKRGSVVRSQPFKLTIKPLPTEGRPEHFKDGNIGRFSMRVSLGDQSGNVPQRLETGERVIVTATVSGKGNLVSLKPPVLMATDAFDVQQIEASGDDEVFKDASGIEGRRTFQYLLTPLKPGKHRTPTVYLAYFEPVRAAFKTLHVRGHEIEVEGAVISRDAMPSVLAGEDIGPLIEAPSVSERRGAPFIGSPLFWALVGLPLLLFLFVEVRFRYRRRLARDPLARRSRGAGGQAGHRLAEAEQALAAGRVKETFGQIARTLICYFEERANLPATGMTHDELRVAAGDAGFPPELLDDVVAEMENCDFARFAPAATVDQQMRESLSRTRSLIDRLESVKPRIRPS